MQGEIIFYNGFNLLVDILVGLTVWFFCYRHWRDQAAIGYENCMSDISDGAYVEVSYESDGFRWQKMMYPGDEDYLLPNTNNQLVEVPTDAWFSQPEGV